MQCNTVKREMPDLGDTDTATDVKAETDNRPETEPREHDRPSTWGPWLFGITMALVLAFFWWLLIYSHGVAPHA